MKHVLIIEPNFKIASLLDAALSKSYVVRTTQNAQEAIHLCDRTLPDLVLLELSIPNQNGLAFLHELRSHNDWVGVQVVVHTKIPKAESGLRPSQWQQLGVSEYLYKPTTTLADLDERIKKVLNK